MAAVSALAAQPVQEDAGDDPGQAVETEAAAGVAEPARAPIPEAAGEGAEQRSQYRTGKRGW